MGDRQYATGDNQLGVTTCNSVVIHTWHTQCHIRKTPKLQIIRIQVRTQIQILENNVLVGVEVEKTVSELLSLLLILSILSILPVAY